MDSCPVMNVDNTDIDMQHPKFQPEDVQTSHDADLFNDDEDDDKDAGDSMDAVSQPPTSVPRVEKRARDQVFGDTSPDCIRREAQDHIEKKKKKKETYQIVKNAKMIQ
ncbi:hypothetical protein F4604DRAFT_1940199 [Suillus subluteus]|nr:hypothetical protein F4604DRAFT_1940199 [Suillus subluteus]